MCFILFKNCRRPRYGDSFSAAADCVLDYRRPTQTNSKKRVRTTTTTKYLKNVHKNLTYWSYCVNFPVPAGLRWALHFLEHLSRLEPQEGQTRMLHLWRSSLSIRRANVLGWNLWNKGAQFKKSKIEQLKSKLWKIVKIFEQKLYFNHKVHGKFSFFLFLPISSALILRLRRALQRGCQLGTCQLHNLANTLYHINKTNGKEESTKAHDPQGYGR